MKIDPDQLPIIGLERLVRAPELHARDKKVLLMVAKGWTNARIGSELKMHGPAEVKRLFHKMRSNSRPEAVAAAFRFGILYWSDGKLEVVP